MSNKVKRIKDDLEEERNKQLFNLQNTFPGSIVVTIGLLSGHTKEDEFLGVFQEFERVVTNTKEEELKIQDLFEIARACWGNPEIDTDDVVLITDPQNVFSPMVTFLVDGVPMILRRDGIPLGVVAEAIKGNEERAAVEFLF